MDLGWWVGDLIQNGQYALLASVVFWVVCSIVLHELAHGWAALWQGDGTPRELGHMTINPLVHMPPMAWLLFAIVGITYGLMPVDPSRFRWGRRGRIVVAAAGPAMNVLIALVVLTVLGVLEARFFGHGTTPFEENLTQFLWRGGQLNLCLAVFNLLPVPPLDGSSILAGMWWRYYQWMQNPTFLFASMFVLWIVIIGGFGGELFAGGSWLANRWVDLVSGALSATPA